MKSGTKQMERSAELIAAKEMDDDVIAEVYRKKKKEGRLKRTTTAEMLTAGVVPVDKEALADLERRVDALLDTASPAHDDWRRRSGVGRQVGQVRKRKPISVISYSLEIA